MTPRPLQVVSIAELLSRASPACTHVENLCEGGAYLRRPPFRLDLGALDAGHREGLEQYFANTVSMFEPIRHLALKDALVVGQGSVVTRDHCLISESAYESIGGDRAPDGMVDMGESAPALGSEPCLLYTSHGGLLSHSWGGTLSPCP